MKSFVILSLVLAVEAGGLTRVIEGQPAKSGQFPHMVALAYGNDEFECSGAIIGKNWVLTAAHCVTPLPYIYYGQVYVIVGTTDIKNTELRYLIEKFYIHDEYIPEERNNDIALAKVHKPFQYNQYVKEISINPKFIEGDVEAELAGFGYDNNNYGILHWTKVRVVSSEECKKTDPLHNGKQHICAVNERSGGCYGDSGSPLVHNKSIIGVITYKIGPCGSGQPDGYMRISTFYSWIQSTMKKSHSRLRPRLL